VVEVKVAVDDERNLVEDGADAGEGSWQAPPARPVVSIDLGVRAHAGVEQHDAVRVLDEVSEAWLDTGDTAVGLVARADEVAEVDASYGGVVHTVTLPGRAGEVDGSWADAAQRPRCPSE
jgi:hypothetical protein